jgi:Fe-S oxidoreductase
VRPLLERLYGIDRRRPLPLPATQSFDAWFASRKRPGNGKPVALFVDTWNRFTEPEIAIAAVELLESCGYSVEVTASSDALRTRLSVGLLAEARQLGGKLFNELASFTDRNVPILCLEPSEASSLCDDLPDLVEEQELAGRVVRHIFLLDDFLAARLEDGEIRLRPLAQHSASAVTFHPHCHQRALFQASSTVHLLTAAGLSVNLSDWGCCGMAGSFGYTHYDVSKKVAEQRFVPGVRQVVKSGGVVVATGTSCRQQALDFCNYRPLHWVQLLRGEPV